MKIKIKELEEVIHNLFAELHDLNVEEIEIEKEDFYWSIPKKDLYNPYIQPNNLTLGQLSDDIEHIHKIATQQLPIVNYDFIKLSSIFQLIGYKNISESINNKIVT